ncbi:MAG TPA: type VI secretion system protein TssA [Aquabacterium sp.]|uniref:type VI secretion system protein TssA n=1 Tax=Aquabacterium sp. TaxID=1872578 RepID=UPI002E31CCB4|nr:type VI secretion system protein TssA [Aquabacterium sp.]HEX5373971.1 type VI secretion system protein TssA [Aquabacterium sp.]
MSDCAAQVDAWLEPLGDPPCGEDLEYDNEFLDLTKASEGKPETQFSAAEPPDWSRVIELSESLLNRTRDIRVALLWGRGQLHREGLSSLPHTLRLIRELLERYWDDAHPKPDPDDGDAYARLNVLAQLEDASTLLGDIRQSLIFRSRAIGQLTVRDLEVALGSVPAREDESPMTVSGIEEMLRDAVAEDEGLRDLASRTRDELDHLLNLLDERAGYGRGPSCDTLKEMLSALAKVTPSADGGSGLDDLDSLLGDLAGGSSTDDHEEAPSRRASRGGGGGLGDSIDTREDAIKAIDLVCAYLERTEPTNPAQMFLRRAQKLIDKNFLELVKELAPEALNEVAKIMGVDPNSVAGGMDDSGY